MAPVALPTANALCGGRLGEPDLFTFSSRIVEGPHYCIYINKTYRKLCIYQSYILPEALPTIVAFHRGSSTYRFL